jgi:hypothetical protein
VDVSLLFVECCVFCLFDCLARLEEVNVSIHEIFSDHKTLGYILLKHSLQLLDDIARQRISAEDGAGSITARASRKVYRTLTSPPGITIT